MKTILAILILTSSLSAFASAESINPTGEIANIQKGNIGNGTAASQVSVYVDKDRGVACYVTMLNVSTNTNASVINTSVPGISCVKL